MRVISVVMVDQEPLVIGYEKCFWALAVTLAKRPGAIKG